MSRPRSARVAGIGLLAVFFAACAGTPVPRAEQEAVEIRPVHEGGATGVEAVVRLDASPERVERWLLDFDRIAADRPGVLESALVEREPDAWVARFRLRGTLGVDPTAVVRTTRRTVGGSVLLEFQAIETSFGLSGLRGSYRISGDGRGGTVLVHRLFIASAFSTLAGQERDMLEDARAIRALRW